MTAELHKVPPEEGYYLLWERAQRHQGRNWFYPVRIGEYFHPAKGRQDQTHFHLAGTEMSFMPHENGANQAGHDWYFGPLDIEVPELPEIPS